MRRLTLGTVVLAALFLAAPATPAPTSKLASVTLDGVGGVVPGMSVDQIQSLWGVPIRPAGRACAFVPFRYGGVRGHALFTEGKLGALFFDAGATTLSGVGIGTRLVKVRKLFGERLESQPGSAFLFLTRHDKPRWQIRFDIDASGRVTQIGFGENWYVHVLSGCG